MVMMAFCTLPSSAYPTGVGSVHGFKVVKTKTTSVKLKWKKVNGATGYQIYYSTKKSGHYKKAKTIKKGSKVKATVKKLKSNKTYYFKIRAIKKKQKGYFTLPVKAKTKKKTRPGKVKGLKVVKITTSSVTLKWKKPKRAKGYQIYYSTQKTKGYKKAKTINKGTTVKATVKNLKSNKKYYFKVRAVNKKKTGKFSKPVAAKTKAKKKKTTKPDTPTYSITYELDGGKASNPTSYTAKDKVTIKDPSKRGYTFDGWTGTGLSKLTKGLVLPKGSTGNRKYEAHWTADEFSITYETNGGQASNPTSYTIEDEVSINDPTRTGYTFDGWTGTDLTELTKNLVIPRGSTDPRAYEAHWTANQYTVVFDSNTGIGNMDSVTFTYDVSGYLPANSFTNSGSKFICWNTKPDGSGDSYKNEASVKNLAPEGLVTLYAQWASVSDFAVFKDGRYVNATMKQLAGNSGASYNTADTNIKSIRRSETPAPEGTTLASVEAINSPSPLYMWYEGIDKTIYYYSPAKFIFLNQDSKNLFSDLSELTYIDFDGFRTDDTTNMFGMFSQSTSLQSLDLSSFNTAKVTDMGSMFNGCSGLTDINVSTFDTRKVKNMNRMFSACEKINHLDLSSFNTSNVTNMEKMFDYLPLIETLDVSSFDTSNVTNMCGMFRDCPKLQTLDLSGFDTGNVKDMSDMFGCTDRCETSGFTSITINRVKFNTSKVTTMKRMFYKCSRLSAFDLSGFNTAQVKDMSEMFAQCSSLTALNLSSFNTGSVTNMSRMFEKMSKLTTIYAGDSFTTEIVTNGSNMFMDDTKLEGGMGTKCDGNHNIGHPYARIDGGEPSPGYFTRKE